MDRFLKLPYLFELVAVIIILSLALLIKGPFDLKDLGTFLTIVGFVYGVLAAFTMTHAWNRFINIRSHNSEEASALINVLFMADSLKDNSIKKKLKKRIKDYCNFMLQSKWGEVRERMSEADKKLLSIVSLLKEIKVSDKDGAIMENLVGELGKISNNKSNQMVLAANRVTKEHWFLLGFLSLVTSFGLFLANDPTSFLSVFTTAAGVSVIMLILIALYDMDNLSLGTEAITVKPYKRVLEVVERI